MSEISWATQAGYPCWRPFAVSAARSHDVAADHAPARAGAYVSDACSPSPNWPWQSISTGASMWRTATCSSRNALTCCLSRGGRRSACFSFLLTALLGVLLSFYGMARQQISPAGTPARRAVGHRIVADDDAHDDEPAVVCRCFRAAAHARRLPALWRWASAREENLALSRFLQYQRFGWCLFLAGRSSSSGVMPMSSAGAGVSTSSICCTRRRSTSTSRRRSICSLWPGDSHATFSAARLVTQLRRLRPDHKSVGALLGVRSVFMAWRAFSCR